MSIDNTPFLAYEISVEDDWNRYSRDRLEKYYQPLKELENTRFEKFTAKEVVLTLFKEFVHQMRGYQLIPAEECSELYSLHHEFKYECYQKSDSDLDYYSRYGCDEYFSRNELKFAEKVSSWVYKTITFESEYYAKTGPFNEESVKKISDRIAFIFSTCYQGFLNDNVTEKLISEHKK